MRSFILTALISFSCVILPSCDLRRSASLPPISEETLVDFYTSYLIEQEKSMLLARDSMQAKHKTDSLLAHFGITKSSFDSAMSHYHGDLDRWRHLQQAVVGRLESLQQQSNNKRSAK